MARERFQEGVRFFDTGQYEKARAAFLQAYALKSHPAVLLNLAQSELRAGYEADAAKHFALYLKDATQATSVEKQEAQKGLATAKIKLAEVTLVGEQGAEIKVDGNPQGTTPLAIPLYLKPGSHKLEATKSGKTVTVNVTAVAGQSTTQTISFAPSAPTPAPAPVAGTGTPPDEGSSTGFELSTSEPREPFIEWSQRNRIAWIGGGATALGLIGGVSFAFAAKSAYDDANNVRDQILAKANERNTPAPCSNPDDFFRGACETYNDKVDSGDGRKTLSLVSFIFAGLAAGGTVGYYFYDTRPQKKESALTPKPSGVNATLVPVVNSSETGVNLIGHF